VVQQRLQIGGERVVVIAGGGLAGLAEAAAVVGDRAVARIEQRALLALPRMTVQRITVNQDDRLPAATLCVSRR
jgi:hypothetical protein